MCSNDLHIDNDSLFRHTGAGQYPSPLPTWMPTYAGMTSLIKVLRKNSIKVSIF